MGRRLHPELSRCGCSGNYGDRFQIYRDPAESDAGRGNIPFAENGRFSPGNGDRTGFCSFCNLPGIASFPCGFKGSPQTDRFFHFPGADGCRENSSCKNRGRIYFRKSGVTDSGRHVRVYGKIQCKPSSRIASGICGA